MLRIFCSYNIFYNNKVWPLRMWCVGGNKQFFTIESWLVIVLEDPLIQVRHSTSPFVALIACGIVDYTAFPWQVETPFLLLTLGMKVIRFLVGVRPLFKAWNMKRTTFNHGFEVTVNIGACIQCYLFCF